MEKTYSRAEVSRHSGLAEGVWVTRGHTVYDVTPFLDDHPGGVDVILPYAGKAIDGVLEDAEAHSHTPFAYEVLTKHAIGELLPEEAPHTPEEVGGAGPQASTPTGGAATYHSGPRVPSAAFLDLERPLMGQMLRARYTKAFYLQQVHIPRHLSHPARFFESDFLEAFTKTPWFAIPIVWGSVVAASVAYATSQLGGLVVAAAYVFGLVLWTLLEYSVHRFVFHMEAFLPDRQFAFVVHFLLHAVHHLLPMDHLRLVMPPALFAALSSSFWLGFTALCGLPLTCALMGGGISGYIAYDMVHYAVHHADGGAWSYFRRVKRHHTEHHYGANPNAGYGVSSTFWDRVFGTDFNPPVDAAAKRR